MWQRWIIEDIVDYYQIKYNISCITNGQQINLLWKWNYAHSIWKKDDCIRCHINMCVTCQPLYIVFDSKTLNLLYLQHELKRQELIAGTNVPNCWVCLGPVQVLFISTSLGSHTHNTHAVLWFNQRQSPFNPHTLSSKIHKGKVLNDFLSLPVFTACCPHPPCLLPVRQRKSGGIMAEVAAGFLCVYVCGCVCFTGRH